MRIANYLLKKEQKTRKKVGDIMGGKVLELYSEKMERLTKEACERASKKGLAQGLAQGLEQGLEQGLQQGVGQGESRLASLLKKLRADNRLSDLDLVLDNTEYREQLYRKYQL